jgi:hypothetical protein
MPFQKGNTINVGRHPSAETRAKLSKIATERIKIFSPTRGKHHNEETKHKIRQSLTGKKRPPYSDEWKQHIGEALKGNKNGRYFKNGFMPSGKAHPSWKGGKRMTRIRSYAIRKCLGHDALNEQFEGSEGHHFDKVHIVFIPKELHRSVWHSLDKPETMEQINTKVICWLLGVDLNGRN